MQTGKTWQLNIGICMKALILAAGLGTRLFPYTTDRPKALVELNGTTLLELAIRKVCELNPSHIVINIHHFGDQILEYLEEKDNFNLPITVSDEREQLLDTGGAILKAKTLLGEEESFVVYNADVLSSMDLNELARYHHEKGGIVTMAVRERITDRYLLFDQNMELSGWENQKTGETKIVRKDHELSRFAFSGIQIVEPELFSMITETGKFPIIPMYLRIAENATIVGYKDTSQLWMDLGKPEQLLKARALFTK